MKHGIDNFNEDVDVSESEPFEEPVEVNEEELAETESQEEPVVNENVSALFENSEEEPKKSKAFIVIVIVTILLIIGGVVAYFLLPDDKESKPAQGQEEQPTEKTPEEEEEDVTEYLAYQMKGNSISDFDLYFLKLENNGQNKVYSPLSIKYALEMLNEGANGKTKEQISRVVGEYSPKKYKNSKNMSFANALFIKNSYKEHIKTSYKDNLMAKFNAEIIYDSFDTPDKINAWISDKTFKLINGLIEDPSELEFILVNALAIDMEWVEKIQPDDWYWNVGYIHEDYFKSISGLTSFEADELNFHKLLFNNKNVASVEAGALINKYDIIKDLGEENIRKTVGDAYQQWLDDGADGSCYESGYSDENEKDPDRETFVDGYMKELSENYKQIDSSTDFSFYIDSNVKIFAKDLKKYNGTTLEYIAIMPTKTSLTDYIKNVSAADINSLIGKIKPIALGSFTEDKITDLTAYIPMFNYSYKLNLMDDLKKLGIKHAFDYTADLSNITDEKVFIQDALHEAKIDFSNYGIKAAAVSAMGGGGAGDCGWDYIFKIPENKIEKIDLTFDKPFMYLIVDKSTKEVWFAGSVYEPAEYDSYVAGIEVEENWD